MEATRACAQQLEVLRLELTYAGRALQSARAVALQGWSGQARTAFTELYDECLDQAVALVREAGEMHASTVLVQGDVLAAHDQMALAGWVNRAADVGLAVDAVQAGLDPVTDVATAMVKGSARQVVAGVADGLERAVARAVASVVARRAALATLRTFASYAAPRVASALAADLLLQAALGQDLDPREAAESGALGALLPPGRLEDPSMMTRIRALTHRDFNLRSHEGTNLGHTLSRHVARNLVAAEARLAGDPSIVSASTFLGESTGNTALRVMWNAHITNIESWAATGARTRLVLRSRLPHRLRVGGVVRGPDGTLARAQRRDLVSMTMVLVRRDDGSIYVLTLYPSEKGLIGPEVKEDGSVRRA